MIELLPGDCIAVLDCLPAGSFDACITDPPYHLASIVKRFGSSSAAPAKFGKDGAFARASRGFMGKTWDGGDTAFRPETWAAVARVMKPGAHLCAFGGARTFHRMAVAIEDAGFEIRDCLSWLYGQGLPKSHNLHGDKAGWGTALKPGWEPIILARIPLTGSVATNVAACGTGALHIDACRTDAGRWPANVLHDGSAEVIDLFPDAPGQLVDASTKPGPATRNVYGAWRRSGERSAGARYDKRGGTNSAHAPGARRCDAGSAARFFYCAKATKTDRAGSKHPTVKPVTLLRWLCRLVTPEGGTILDPFAGSGTLGAAARDEGFAATLIEREPEYQNDIRRRFGLYEGIFA